MNVGRFVRKYIMSAVLIYYSGNGWSASWQQAGSARMSTEYDTNPNMSITKPDGVWHAIFVPSYTLSGHFGENELNTGIALQTERSSNKVLIQSRDDPSAFLELKLHGEADELGVSTKFDQTSTRISEIASSGPGVADSTRTAREISGIWNKELGERSTLSVDGSYTDNSYSSTSYNDYVLRSGNMMFQYEWSEVYKPFIKISYSDYEPANSTPPGHSAIAALGFNWKSSDHLDGILQFGKSRDSSAGMGNQGLFSLHYTGQLSEHVVSAGRQVSASGLGGFVTVDQANWNWNYSYDEINKFGIDLGWQKNHYLNAAFYGTAGFWQQHEFNSFWSLRTYYLLRSNRQIGIGEATSDMLGVTITYNNMEL